MKTTFLDFQDGDDEDADFNWDDVIQDELLGLAAIKRLKELKQNQEKYQRNMNKNS